MRMPELGVFESADAYYSRLYHGLIHSTGHESRLNRLEPALFGTDPYAREELVPEMGAAMLAGTAGLEPRYDIEGWLRRLPRRPRARDPGRGPGGEGRESSPRRDVRKGRDPDRAPVA
jgi:antirestriction protein ArdC